MNSVKEKSQLRKNDAKKPKKGKLRKSKRTPQKRVFFHEQKFKTNKKRKISSNVEVTDSQDVSNAEQSSVEEVGPTPLSEEEIRERHVEKLTLVFRDYIEDKLDELDLPIDREKTRVTGMIKNLKNSIKTMKNVYDSDTMGYLVTSSDGKETYTVKQKAIADKRKHVCNCGTKYEEPDRTSCKHCGAMIFYNFDQFMTDYLTKKPTANSMNLQMHHMQKNFNKFDIEEPVKPVKQSGSNQSLMSNQSLTAAEQSKNALYANKDIDFFDLVLQGY